MRLLIVEDQTIMREALATLLSLEDDFEVVGTASDAETGVQLALSLRPDLTLMDIGLPGMSGIEATRIVTRAGACRVVILTTHQQESVVFEGIRAGALGYLLKDAPAALLVDTIRRVAQGEGVLQPGLALRLLADFRTQGEELTPRELEVLQHMAHGKANKLIARELGVSEGTVKNHVSSILAKLHARNRVQATNTARGRGLIS